MKVPFLRFQEYFSAVLLTALLVGSASSEDDKPAISAMELAARMRPKASGQFSARLTLKIRSNDDGAMPQVLQVLIKGVREAGSSKLLWQAMYPRPIKGAGALVLREQGKPPHGAVYVPGGEIRTIQSENFGDALFGSDLSYEDLDQSFWNWEMQIDRGRMELEGVPCRTIESRSKKTDRSVYGTIRSVIDLKRMVPIQIEKFDRAGKLLRLIEVVHVSNLGKGRYVADEFIVSSPQRGTSTEVKAASLKKATYSANQFEPEALLQLTMP